MSGITTLSTEARAVVDGLSNTGEHLVASADLSAIVGASAEDWARFAKNWEDLKLDTFMADGGTYRYRRYGQFELDPFTDELTLLPHEPYRQEKFFNKLNGGVDRVYEPLTDEFVNDPLLRKLVIELGHIFTTVDDTRRWLVKLHPVRIIAGENIGQPAPEGRHRDGVTFVGSLLLDRLNITGGESTTYDEQQNLLRTVTLSERGDLLLGDDQRTYHQVTPIEAVDKTKPAHRDVLVVNYCSLPGRLPS
ncbi:2OG-Fe dioxygenase family protein [Saccharomonospora sp. NB11]|uniref:2OG-Fe dioxygenase family protein n=1 Tax=Saccharomonospora sp. NB11 TaxID=1642298 RepID=UPI0018D12763|nr:2OG-Fe dioxygenase family protein [Saccharomonospora sp. NB11]